MLNFCKPDSHITIEIRPYLPEFTKKHRHGATHLVRIVEREPVNNDTSGALGKLRNILEQEVVCDPKNLHGVGRCLRRAADSVSPYRRKRKAKKRSGLGGRIDEAKANIAARPKFLRGDEVGGGYGSGQDYREA
jgi:hypothetical protein